jgi:hypothetical protein
MEKEKTQKEKRKIHIIKGHRMRKIYASLMDKTMK